MKYMWRRWSICCKVCCTDICKSFPHGNLRASSGSTSPCHLEKRCHFQMCYSTVVTLGLNYFQKNPKPQQSMFSNANVHSFQSFQIQCNAESLELLHVPSVEEELRSAHSLLLSSLSVPKSRRVGLKLQQRGDLALTGEDTGSGGS